jgi:hypothetical protein
VLVMPCAMRDREKEYLRSYEVITSSRTSRKSSREMQPRDDVLSDENSRRGQKVNIGEKNQESNESSQYKIT